MSLCLILLRMVSRENKTCQYKRVLIRQIKTCKRKSKGEGPRIGFLVLLNKIFQQLQRVLICHRWVQQRPWWDKNIYDSAQVLTSSHENLITNCYQKT